MEVENELLQGSMVDSIPNIKTGGQSTGGWYDDTDQNNYFNHDWTN